MKQEIEIIGVRVTSRNFSEETLRAMRSYEIFSGLLLQRNSTYVRLRQGVNVLFGPNGVGKTNLLNSIKDILNGFGHGRIYCKGVKADLIQEERINGDSPSLLKDEWWYGDFNNVWDYFSGNRAAFSSFADYAQYRNIGVRNQNPKPWLRQWEQINDVVEREVQEEITGLGIGIGNSSNYEIANSILSNHDPSNYRPEAFLSIDPEILKQIFQQHIFVFFPNNGNFDISLGFHSQESDVKLASLIAETLSMTQNYENELKAIEEQEDLGDYALDNSWLNWVTGFSDIGDISTGRKKSSLLHDGSDESDWCDVTRPSWVPFHLEATPSSVLYNSFDFDEFGQLNTLDSVVWDIDDEWPYDDVEDIASHLVLMSPGLREDFNPFVEDSVQVINKHFADAGDLISELANKYLEQFISDAPLLKYGPTEIRRGKKHEPKWYCSWIKDKNDSTESSWWPGYGPNPYTPAEGVFTIEKLSPTVFRWARFSILLATMTLIDENVDQSFSNVHFICDEPERGFGRAEQKNLSRALNKISEEKGYNFIITTHSPEIIEDPLTHLNRVERVRDHNLGTDTINCFSIDQSEKDSLHRLGLSTAEQLGLDRIYLLVEGMHDLWVLDEFFGTQLLSNRIRVLPMQGAFNMTRIMAPEAQFLFRQTDAHFAFLLDNSCDDKFSEIFTHVNLEKNPLELNQLLQEIETDTTEEQAIKQIISSAIEASLLNRIIGIIGLEKLDILDYLPAHSFIPNREWDDLRSEHKNLRETARTSRRPPSDFKRWCELTYAAEFDEFAVRRAVNAMDEVPSEFVDLINSLITAASIE